MAFILSDLTYAGEIAFTFDDAPREDTPLFTGEARAKKIINKIVQAKVPDPMLFIKADNVIASRGKTMQAYEEAGFVMANHGYAHLSADRVESEMFIDDFNRAHSILSERESFRPFFRYPFLHQGDTKAKRDAVWQHLDNSGYSVGYVTVDNYDWYLDVLLQEAIKSGKNINYQKLKKAYLDILWDAIVFYDELSKKYLGRSVKHVLLLHENDLAALYIHDLAKFIREKGWSIISAEDAYRDETAKVRPDVLFNKQGRVAALARAKGVPENQLRSRFENEEYIREYLDAQSVFE